MPTSDVRWLCRNHSPKEPVTGSIMKWNSKLPPRLMPLRLALEGKRALIIRVPCLGAFGLTISLYASHRDIARRSLRINFCDRNFAAELPVIKISYLHTHSNFSIGKDQSFVCEGAQRSPDSLRHLASLGFEDRKALVAFR